MDQTPEPAATFATADSLLEQACRWLDIASGYLRGDNDDDPRRAIATAAVAQAFATAAQARLEWDCEQARRKQ